MSWPGGMFWGISGNIKGPKGKGLKHFCRLGPGSAIVSVIKQYSWEKQESFKRDFQAAECVAV